MTDRLTGLIWTVDANPAAFPVGWHEALVATAAMNRDAAFGHRDWRVPNRRELRSRGQDGELRLGRPWPDPRFRAAEKEVLDLLTGLCWRRDADLCDRPVRWEEALEAVREFDRSAGTRAGWRLPNINELESLVDCERHSPALPASHPFERVGEEYWSSTTSVFEPDWAWALYLAKGAVGVGRKGGRYFRVWPVRDLLSGA